VDNRRDSDEIARKGYCSLKITLVNTCLNIMNQIQDLIKINNEIISISLLISYLFDIQMLLFFFSLYKLKLLNNQRFDL